MNFEMKNQQEIGIFLETIGYLIITIEKMYRDI